MKNSNYDPNEIGGWLVVTAKPRESFYVFASQDTQPGDYVQIQEKGIDPRFPDQGSKHATRGNRSLIVLREDLVFVKGGLDEVVRQIKEGTFQLKKTGEQQ